MSDELLQAMSFELRALSHCRLVIADWK